LHQPLLQLETWSIWVIVCVVGLVLSAVSAVRQNGAKVKIDALKDEFEGYAGEDMW
jgi:predicted branched-subunit amino acid permease